MGNLLPGEVSVISVLPLGVPLPVHVLMLPARPLLGGKRH
jgi:hypothetical protein